MKEFGTLNGITISSNISSYSGRFHNDEIYKRGKSIREYHNGRWYRSMQFMQCGVRNEQSKATYEEDLVNNDEINDVFGYHRTGVY